MFCVVGVRERRSASGSDKASAEKVNSTEGKAWSWEPELLNGVLGLSGAAITLA